MDPKKPQDAVLLFLAVAGPTAAAILWLFATFVMRDELTYRMAVSDSKRYGEITAHYRKLLETDDMMEAEKYRADIAEREQKRLHGVLTGENDER